MVILGIDTSCDDTAIAVLQAEKESFRILSNVVSSQVKCHQKYGGVYPTLAKREHESHLVLVLKESLSMARLLKSKIKNKKFKTQAKNKKLKEILKREQVLYGQSEKFLEKYQKPKIDAVAVTAGPGLEPCLWLGVNFARALSYWWELPVIPVNHIEAHIVANFIGINSKFKIQNSKLQLKSQNLFPVIALVVSGGHTELILMQKIGRYKIVGETRDDAAGECLDKTARLLKFGYPGGAILAAEAAKYRHNGIPAYQVSLPRPMLNSNNYDFSFSGLKTAVLYDYKKRPSKIKKSKEYIRLMAKEIQQAIIDVLVKKTIKAAKEFRVKTIVLGGGVAANNELRKQFRLKIKELKLKINFSAPPKSLCTDNGLMAAAAGYFNKRKEKKWQDIKVDANLRLC